MARVAKTTDFELDLGRYELRRHGRRIKLERKPMELLIFLVERREQLVSRAQIVGKLWGSGLLIDVEPSINNIVRKLRAALGDDPARPRFVETVVGKGYRFIGPVRLIPDAHSTAQTLSTFARQEATMERASLAVLPLQPVGGALDDRGISLGLADALVSRLGNLEDVDVLPTSAVVSASLGASPEEISSRFSVRFVVRGAIQLSKGLWRLSLELLDARLGKVLFVRKCNIDLNRLPELEDEIAKQIAAALHRPLKPATAEARPRFSKDPLAYEEFIRGYRLSSAGDSAQLERAAHHLANAIVRDPDFSLAHAVLSFVSATRHFEFDPTNTWLEKAEFHCYRALELDADLPEAHVAKAFLLWGPSKNFQHVEAIAELKHALALRNNLPHAYNRLGTILAHIGLLDSARAMYEKGSAFHAKKAVSHSIVQVYIWSGDHERARNEVEAWRSDSPGNKYPLYFAPQAPMMTGDWEQADRLLDEALRKLPEEPLIISLQGVFFALKGDQTAACDSMNRACAIPRSFGHAHHTYYQIACILSLLGRQETAFAWLERSVASGFACWPFFLQDPCLQNIRSTAEFEPLISALQARYPQYLGFL